MLRLVAGRVLQGFVAIAVLGSIVFALAEISPIDPARMSLTHGVAGVSIDDEAVTARRAELGLDRPMVVRYVAWWQDLARLDLGRSYMTTRPVTQMLQERIGNSMLLGGAAFAFTALVGIGVGLALGFNAGRPVDLGVRAVVVCAASIPSFWLAFLLIWLFAAHLQWLPAIGQVSAKGIVLPALTLALVPTARLIRLTRATTLGVLEQQYVTTAYARGATTRRVALRHVLPNALIPIASLFGLDFAAMVGHALVVESVFSWPGISRLAADAALAGDLPVLSTVILLLGVLVVGANLTVDILTLVLDPRRRDPS